MIAMIWHEIVCWFLKTYQYLKRFAAQEQRIVVVLDVQNNFMFPTSKNIQKWVKINRQTFVIWWPNATGIDLFDIYLAVGRSEILHILKKPNGLWFFCEVLIFANSMSSFLKSLLSLWSMFHQNNSDCWRFLEFWIVKILIS